MEAVLMLASFAVVAMMIVLWIDLTTHSKDE